MKFYELCEEILSGGLSPKEMKDLEKNNEAMTKMTKGFIKDVGKILKPLKVKTRETTEKISWVFDDGSKVFLVGHFGRNHTNVIVNIGFYDGDGFDIPNKYITPKDEGSAEQIEYHVNDLKVYQKFLDASYDSIENKIK